MSTSITSSIIISYCVGDWPLLDGIYFSHPQTSRRDFLVLQGLSGALEQVQWHRCSFFSCFPCFFFGNLRLLTGQHAKIVISRFSYGSSAHTTVTCSFLKGRWVLHNLFFPESQRAWGSRNVIATLSGTPRGIAFRPSWPDPSAELCRLGKLNAA